MFDFLKTATVSDVVEKTVARRGGPRKDRNPEGMAIRVFRDGSVFPSTALVSMFNLEYPAAKLVGRKDTGKKDDQGAVIYQNEFEVEGDKGNGFDVIDTKHYPSFQVAQRILLVNPVNRKNGRVDLFGSVSYEETGEPKSSVLEQGAKTFGSEELIPMLEEVYGLKFRKKVEGSDTYTDGLEYVDMLLVANPATGEPWKKDFTFIPKKVSRGKAAGTYNTVRREYAQFYAFVPKPAGDAEQPTQNEDEAVKAPETAEAQA